MHQVSLVPHISSELSSTASSRSVGFVYATTRQGRRLQRVKDVACLPSTDSLDIVILLSRCPHERLPALTVRLIQARPNVVKTTVLQVFRECHPSCPLPCARAGAVDTSLLQADCRPCRQDCFVRNSGCHFGKKLCGKRMSFKYTRAESVPKAPQSTPTASQALSRKSLQEKADMVLIINRTSENRCSSIPSPRKRECGKQTTFSSKE